MPERFKDGIVWLAFKSAHDKCQKCDAPLDLNKRNQRIDGGWGARHIDMQGRGNLANCRILCIPCYDEARSDAKRK